MAKWYETCPERLDAELRALAEAGFRATIDGQARAAGHLLLHVAVSVDGEEHDFQVEFPDDYPYFPFLVFAPSLSLPRHQDPYSKQLCFVRHIETEWSTGDSVAEYLQNRLPNILASARADGPTDIEAHEGAPVTGYLPFAPSSVVLIGDWTLSPTIQSGTLLMGIEQGSDPQIVLRAAVHAVKSGNGEVLAALDSQVASIYPSTFAARWVRLPARPRAGDFGSIMAEAISIWPALQRCQFNNGAPDVVGIVFPDEARYRENHDIWVFLVRRKERFVRTSKRRRLPSGDKVIQYLARADRAGRSDLQARVPRLAPLTAKRAAIFGLGALGSAVACQLAKSGVGHLVLVDPDVVTAGTAARWALGLRATGHFKSHVLAAHIRANYPYVDPTPIALRLGHTRNGDMNQVLADALTNVEVIIDCTVEKTVHHYLSHVAQEKALPFIWASATPGAWGGIVGRALPDKDRGCWECFCHHQMDETIPAPAQEEGPDIQPIGCFSPTFQGTGFDLDHVALMCARLAVATLCRGTQEGYGDFTWDIAVLDLWKDGQPIAPLWRTLPLPRHEACGRHR